MSIPMTASPAPTVTSFPECKGFVNAKVNGTKQLLMVVMNKYPRPIMADDKVPASEGDLPQLSQPQ